MAQPKDFIPELVLREDGHGRWFAFHGVTGAPLGQVKEWVSVGWHTGPRIVLEDGTEPWYGILRVENTLRGPAAGLNYRPHRV